MASGFFGLLAKGASFSGRADVAAFKQKQKRASSGSVVAPAPDADELDFFGFNAVEAKSKEDKPAPRARKISEDMIPGWAGNERKAGAPKGSKPRRKRKLSEGAIEEQKLEDEERRQASQLLAPKSSKALKRRRRKERRRSRSESMGSELSESKRTAEDSEEEKEDNEEPQEEEEESEDEEDKEAEEQNVSLFKNGQPAPAPIDSAAISTDSKTDKAVEEVAVFRRQMGIRVSGSTAPPPIADFAAMRVRKHQQKIKAILLKNIEASEYKEPTPVQMQAIPSMLLGRDVLATAPTGSGKTAAFAIPMLANLAVPSSASNDGTTGASGIRSVVLSPTRELAVQIHAEFTRLSKGKKLHLTLLSKATAATIANQVKNQMSVHVDVLVATPLRLVHLIKETSLDLSSVEMVCLDEADRLFDMGFVEQIDEVLAACTNPKVQRAMFSATMLEGVEEMAQSVLRDPIKVAIGVKNAGAATIDQKLVFVGKEEGKLVAMKQLIQNGLQLPALLFVQNKERAQELYHELLYDGISIGAVHADRTKEQRDQVIRQFRTGEIWVLICTDLMSRGIDFKAVNMVINYDFPQSAVSYIHRIGRTGRGGRKGHAVTFFTEDDMEYLRSIANVMKLSGCEVPDWMLSLKKASVNKRKALLKAPPQRRRISTVSGYDLQKANRIKTLKHRGQGESKTAQVGDDEASANEKPAKKKGKKTNKKEAAD